MYEESGDGAAIMTNGDLGDRLYQEILRTIAAEYGWPDFKQVRKTAIPVSPELLREYEGTYAAQAESYRPVEQDGVLWPYLSWRPKVRLYAESGTRFFANEDNVPTVNSLRNAAGVVYGAQIMGRTAQEVK